MNISNVLLILLLAAFLGVGFLYLVVSNVLTPAEIIELQQPHIAEPTECETYRNFGVRLPLCTLSDP